MNKEKLFFSIVIPLYNKEYSIEKCLKSVLNQTYTNYELIIVNDGSTDNSEPKVIKTIQGLNNIKYTSQKNQGVSVARNRGVELSSADLVCFLDADDEWLPTFLEKLVELIYDYPNANLYSLAHFVKKNDTEARKGKHGLPDGYRGYVKDFFKASTNGSVVNSSKVCVRKTPFLNMGGFPEGVVAAEDLYVWIKMAMNGSVACDMSYLCIVNQTEDSSRKARKNSIPYPIVYFSKNKQIKRSYSLERYLFNIFLKHFITSLKKLKIKEAYLRASSYSRMFL